MFKERMNSIGICKDESKHSFRITVFEDFIKFFPHFIARETIVREAYVVKSRFFCGGGGGVSPRRKGFVEKVSDVSLYQV